MSPLSLLMLQPGDNKLAHSAQMYHYQHQKQQMLSLEKWVTPWAQTRSSLPAHMRPSPAPHPTLPCVPCLICVNLWIFYDCDLCRHRDEPKVPDSGASTDEENDDGDFTVYECPGLAPVSRLCFFFLADTFSFQPLCSQHPACSCIEWKLYKSTKHHTHSTKWRRVMTRTNIFLRSCLRRKRGQIKKIKFNWYCSAASAGFVY